MSCTAAVVSRTYVLTDAAPGATGFLTAADLTALGTEGVITNSKARLDNTDNAAEAIALYIADADLTSEPDGLKTVFRDEVGGLEPSATEVSYDVDIEKYYSVASAGDLKVGANVLAIDASGNAITIYLTITARLLK